MKIEIDGSRVRTGARTAVDYLLALHRRLAARLRSAGSTAAALGVALAAAAVAVLSAVWRRTTGATRTVARRLRAAIGGDTARAVARTVRHGLFGRRGDVSAVAALLAPVLALAAEWWVVRTVGYRTVEGWVRGTWTGTDPQVVVFLGAAALVGLAAASAAVNSGLVPTTALVTGPLFGVAFARYGLVVEPYGTVGLVEATTTGAALALAVGVPVGAAGFLLGVTLRRVASTLAGGAGGEPAVRRV
jgi:hypothetical protein